MGVGCFLLLCGPVPKPSLSVCILRSKQRSILDGHSLPCTFICRPTYCSRRKSQTGGAKARVTFTLRRGKAGAEGILFQGEILRPESADSALWFLGVPRSRGSEWARTWGRRMDGSRVWDPRGGAQGEHLQTGMHLREASPEEPRLGAPIEPCPRRVRPAGHRHSPSRGISPATPACPGC